MWFPSFIVRMFNNVSFNIMTIASAFTFCALKAHSHCAICDCYLVLLLIDYIGGDHVVGIALCEDLH